MSVAGVASTGTAYLLNLLNDTSDASAANLDFASDFETIDSGVTGVVTQAEFEQAFASLLWPDWLKAGGADAIFAQLDPEGTGRVQYGDFVARMTALATALAPSTGPSVADQSSTDSAATSSGLTGIGALLAGLSAPSATDQTSETAAPADDDAVDAGALDANPLDADTLAALTRTFEDAYAVIDTSGTGYITAPQLAQAFGSLSLPDNIAALGASGILAKLDPHFTGQISHQDFVDGLIALASLPAASGDSTPVAAPTASDSASSDDDDDVDEDEAALMSFYASVFSSIAPDDGSDELTQVDIDNGFDQLQLPASLRSLTPSELFGRLDPYSTGRVSRDNFIRDMTDLVSAAKAQEAEAAAASAASAHAGDRDFAAMFATMDVEGSGSVTLARFEQMFDSLPLDPAVAVLGADAIFAMLGPDASGCISTTSFVNGIGMLMGAVDYFRGVADSIDLNGDGSITPDEFQQAFASLQLPPAILDLGADDVYARIDPFYTRQATIDDFINGLTALVAELATPAPVPSNMSDGELFLTSFYAGGPSL